VNKKKILIQLFLNPLFCSRIFQYQFLRLKPAYNKRRHTIEQDLKKKERKKSFFR